MEIQSKNTSNKFYLLIGVGVTGLISGAYFLWSYFKQDEEKIEEEQLFEISEIKGKEGKKLTKQEAVKLIYFQNQLIELEIKKAIPNNFEKRIKFIENQDEYKKACEEYFTTKQVISIDISKKLIKQFGTSKEEFNSVMRHCDHEFIENEYFKYEKEKISNFINKEKAKEIYLYYCTKFLNQADEFSSYINKEIYKNNSEEDILYNLLLSKIKSEDYLYIKYRISEIEMKYYLKYYNLYEDKEIKEMINKLQVFEKITDGL